MIMQRGGATQTGIMGLDVSGADHFCSLLAVNVKCGNIEVKKRVDKSIYSYCAISR